MTTEDKITVRELNNMRLGETRTYKIANAKVRNTAVSLAYQQARVLGCTFSVRTDYANKLLSITKRKPRTANNKTV